ncbi:WXG100 family type VII secretion target [Nocardia sp. NBC_01503]|uniref:WXG100 family type VII secretion target n=1 Tax=Nocardia sp. NBC_01503 TaxID=2975997 RepID=UPI002E7ABC26|nr:WXG100 family type VII secretion target [Nocardia sp. NBC_01503]WTL29915.1 WXG100 family type VII secretion target [Nocardia sp. NBC_01503]
MLYNFEEIDTHTSQLGGIIDKMEQHTAHISAVRQDLLNSGFFGSAATGYDDVMTQLNTRLTQYQSSLAQLKGAIGSSSDLMRITDTNNGKGFAGIL